MNKRPFAGTLATLFIITLIASGTFFIVPQKVSASALNCTGGILGFGAAKITSSDSAVPVKNIPIEGSTFSSSVSAASSCINDVILIPLARAAIRAMLQKMTASVIMFINGQSNGNGSPQYVQSLQKNLQTVGDTQALAFFAQFEKNSNSPFASAISSSLRKNYLQNTSSAGFWDANKCTLSASSPNIDDYLKGDWSQGGTDAWFALTTQKQNNPYTFHQSSQKQLASAVTSAQDTRKTELNWGQGFLSWCSASETASNNDPLTPPPITPTPTLALGNNQFAPDNNGPKADGQSCSVSTDCTSNYCEGGICRRNLAREVGVNPGDPCYDKDGKPGAIKTPGSVIHDYTQKAVVASGFDQLISANDLDNALGAIIAALLNQVLGSVSGLFGSSDSSGSISSITSQLQGYTSSNTSSTQTALNTAQEKLSDVLVYKDALNTISSVADVASTSVASLISLCIAQQEIASSILANGGSIDPANFISISNLEISSAQTALTTEIAPVLTQVQEEINSVSATESLALQVEAESSNGATAGTSGSLESDISLLVSMPPTMQDITGAQQEAQVSGGAIASPAGSLTVSGGSLVDQMNLISANATARKSVCTLN